VQSSASPGRTDRVGVVDEPNSPQPTLGTQTYAQLGARVTAWASALDQLGLAEGDRVAVVAPNSARLLELLYAVPSSGRIIVPINYRLRPDEVRYIVDHSGARLLLVDPELEPTLADVGAEHRLLLGEETDQLLNKWAKPRPWSALDENQPASINYTSGTTARPKGAVLTHRNLWLNAVMMAVHYGISDRDVYLPPFHCNGWGLPYTCAGLGIPQIVLRKVDGRETLRRIKLHGVTLLAAAPAVIAMILDALPDWDGPVPGHGQLRVICGGAPPPTRLVQRLEEELGWEFSQIYGMTETSPLLAANRATREDFVKRLEERARHLVTTAGPPALGVCLTERGGEILARGNGVLAEYWRQPEETANTLHGGWFHTGDGGRLDDQARLVITDRKKDVIITGGENVSSIEVEDTLHNHPDVVDVAVIGVPSERWGETIKAVVVLTPEATATPADLIAHCKRSLAGYKAPTSVEIVNALPRTATGKTQKYQLREQYWRGRDRQVS
jgi:fatty-acyl-CoA synthase